MPALWLVRWYLVSGRVEEKRYVSRSDAERLYGSLAELLAKGTAPGLRGAAIVDGSTEVFVCSVGSVDVS